MRKKYYIFFLIILLTNTIYANNKITIFTTTEPIYSLIKELTKELAYVISPKDVSTDEFGHQHYYKVSDINNIDKADLIVAIDPSFEFSFLDKLSLEKSKIMLISNIKNLKIYKQKDNENEIDWHIWFDIDNIKVIVTQTAKRLIKLDSENSAKYKKNLSELIKKLNILQQEIKTQLVKKEYSIFQMHDGYQYFEKYFNILSKDYIGESTPITIKTLINIKNKINKFKINCIFSSPHFSDKKNNFFIKNTNAKVFILDPMFVNTKNNEILYLKLLKNIANHYKKCE